MIIMMERVAVVVGMGTSPTCEAAVDNPLLYKSWGKNQTYIVAFHDPFYSTNSSDKVLNRMGHAIPLDNAYNAITRRFPPVEDITRQYTSDEIHVIDERRGISEEPVAEAIDAVPSSMVQLLKKLGNQR